MDHINILDLEVFKKLKWLKWNGKKFIAEKSIVINKSLSFILGFTFYNKFLKS